MKRFLLVLLGLSIMSLLWGCGGGGKSGSDIPTGARLFITPADDIKVESSGSVVENASQLFAVAARDAVPGATTGTTTGSTTASTVVPVGKGIRDAGFFITFEFSDPPGREVLADTAGAVTLCDGTRIINTRVQKVTDSDGNYNLCVSYKTGGGVAYTGRLIVSSGDQSPFVNFIITAKPQPLAVSPPSQTIPAGSLAQFTIVGGVPPYAVAASPALLPPVPAVVTTMGGSFNVVAPLGTPDGLNVNYTVTDAAGSQVAVSLTIGKPASQPKILPDKSDVIPGGKAQFIIVDGYPPYTIVSSNPLVPPSPATLSSSGGTFTAAVPLTTQAGSQITFTARDSAGSAATAVISVTTPPELKLTPTTATAVAGETMQFAVFGGIPGYVVTTSNAAVIASPSSVLKSGGTFRISIPDSTPAGTVTVYVTDVAGSTTSATITVTAAPLRITPPGNTNIPAGGGTRTFIISGGTPPYITTSSNPALAYNSTVGNGQWTTSAITVTIDPTATTGLMFSLQVSDAAGLTTVATITVQ